MYYFVIYYIIYGMQKTDKDKKMNADRMNEKANPSPRKAYSMRFRFLATLILAMLAITILIGGLSIYEVDKYI